MKTSVGAFRRQRNLAPAGQSALACQLFVCLKHLCTGDGLIRCKVVVALPLQNVCFHAPLGCLGGIRVCHVRKGRGLGRLGTACGVPQQQGGLPSGFFGGDFYTRYFTKNSRWQGCRRIPDVL